MIVSTTSHVEGKKIVQHLGLVTGTAIRSAGILKNIVAYIKSLLGGELHEFTAALAQTREQALDRMKEQARSLGANAVISMRFTSSELASSSAEILAYGTAVILEDSDQEGP